VKIGQHLIGLDKVTSTNDYAADLLKRSAVIEGTVILAHEQTAGKGQGNNTWESENGKNLTFTVILHPTFLNPEHQFSLNKAISLAIIDYLDHILKNTAIKIKWPNDIYVDNKKLGGILINNIISGNNFETSIAGIGLNINQTVFNKNIPNPISLKQILKNDLNLQEQLKSLCKCLEYRYSTLKEKHFSTLDNGYKKSLLGYKEWRLYQTGVAQIEGQITGVDEFGRLQINTRENLLLTFSHGEIEV
jgi:BirA family biotin operon repressor/biotin-[acetyl-CoA-carboxylase] ligase